MLGRGRQRTPRVLVAGRKLCSGEEMASSRNITRLYFRAGLFTLALGEGFMVKGLAERGYGRPAPSPATISF